MADQQFFSEDNRFWVDLHKCATQEATGILHTRIKECYLYGIRNLEIVYGTPDEYEGSIKQAVDEIISENPNIERKEEIHAGVFMTIRENPTPTPQDESMHFESMQASYQHWRRVMEYEYDYYPLRKIFTTEQISKDLGCSVEYIRRVVKELAENYAESKTIYNEITRRNETSWNIYKPGYEFIVKKWNGDREIFTSELKTIGATSDEINNILHSVRTPLKPNQTVKSRASAALKRVRKEVR